MDFAIFDEIYNFISELYTTYNIEFWNICVFIIFYAFAFGLTKHRFIKPRAEDVAFSVILTSIVMLFFASNTFSDIVFGKKIDTTYLNLIIVFNCYNTMCSSLKTMYKTRVDNKPPKKGNFGFFKPKKE